MQHCIILLFYIIISVLYYYMHGSSCTVALIAARSGSLWLFSAGLVNYRVEARLSRRCLCTGVGCNSCCNGNCWDRGLHRCCCVRGARFPARVPSLLVHRYPNRHTAPAPASELLWSCGLVVLFPRGGEAVTTYGVRCGKCSCFCRTPWQTDVDPSDVELGGLSTQQSTAVVGVAVSHTGSKPTANGKATANGRATANGKANGVGNG